ncbi:hypothetical protein NLX83_09765 [Allokutzneria sp. A3M-2-11 16]|uniref:hypothetical protein n=1 Tax=Allokutzneria sp. A3M-2-11 16 TaxID=2962043 RepID=UPI0020B734E6|nr:hypothetical protein [Allokutzneria sp. A3M-2-11 16]MCP3799541.1 hypothetical protein [Allokutzneria sp. A3M-2-11 16]
MELAEQTGTATGGSKPVTPASAGQSGSRREWLIGCRDVANRHRSLTVVVEQNRVLLVGPPGETAVLCQGEVSQLRSALREAAEQAER